jgi:hypothetical protein
LHAQAITRDDGVAALADLPTGRAMVSVGADGFESESTSFDVARGPMDWNVRLRAIGAWAAGARLLWAPSSFREPMTEAA